MKKLPCFVGGVCLGYVLELAACLSGGVSDHLSDQPFVTDAGVAGITGSPSRIGGPRADGRAAAARRMGLLSLSLAPHVSALGDAPRLRACLIRLESLTATRPKRRGGLVGAAETAGAHQTRPAVLFTPVEPEWTCLMRSLWEAKTTLSHSLLLVRT